MDDILETLYKMALLLTSISSGNYNIQNTTDEATALSDEAAALALIAAEGNESEVLTSASQQIACSLDVLIFYNSIKRFNSYIETIALILEDILLGVTHGAKERIEQVKTDILAVAEEYKSIEEEHVFCALLALFSALEAIGEFLIPQ
jgi:hypothetical protein